MQIGGNVLDLVNVSPCKLDLVKVSFVAGNSMWHDDHSKLPGSFGESNFSSVGLDDQLVLESLPDQLVDSIKEKTDSHIWVKNN